MIPSLLERSTLIGPASNPAMIAEAQARGHVVRALNAHVFDGDRCIHPSPPPAMDAVFSPTAREVIAACEAATAARRGAISVDGRRLDAADLRLCSDVRDSLPRAERAQT